MISFAFIDTDGIPTGGGRERSLPEGAVPLAEPFTLADLGRIRFRDGAWDSRTDPPTQDDPVPAEVLAEAQLVRARALSVERINTRTGKMRLRIYTDIPGQDALYLEKRAEAVAYVAEAHDRGEPETLDDYPLLANETGITAPTAWHLAQVWLNRSDQFKRVGAATERARMQAILAIAEAPDEAAIEAIERDFTEALTGLSI